MREYNVTPHVEAYASVYVFSMCQAGNPCFGSFVWFIDTSQTACKVICLFVIEMDGIDVPDTENMHCAKLPDAQDDRICSYIRLHASQFHNNNMHFWQATSKR